MNTTLGDLIELGRDGTFDVIIHGCNCHCAMGAGIARAIRAAFPGAWEADRATRRGDRDKLGGISTAEVDVAGHALTVVNAYTQYDASGPLPLADYDAIRSAFRRVKEAYTGRRIGYPRIGAGLAGGDWETIAAIIVEELAGEDHTLVEFGGGSR